MKLQKDGKGGFSRFIETVTLFALSQSVADPPGLYRRLPISGESEAFNRHARVSTYCVRVVR